MQWIPDSIRELKDLLHDSGAFTVITVIFALGSLALLWRHLGKIIDLFERYLEGQTTANRELKTQTLSMNDIKTGIDLGNRKTDKLADALTDKFKTICRKDSEDAARIVLTRKYGAEEAERLIKEASETEIARRQGTQTAHVIIPTT